MQIHMQTENGLTIHRVEREEGGFQVRLLRPMDDGTEGGPFATLSREQGGRWVTNRNQIQSPSLVEAITMVDREYARERHVQETKERSRREARDELNEIVAPDWQAVVDRFGEGTLLAGSC